MASQAWTAWAAVVRKGGGTIVVPPTGAGGYNPNTGKMTVPKVLSAGYPASVWVPRVNTKNPMTGVMLWPLPDEYSANGQTAYYHAPADLQLEAQSVHVATPTEQQGGADNLMKQWGVPDWLKSPEKFLTSFGGSAVMIALVLGVVYVVVNRRK
jgi:hypothetical protein